MSLLGSMMAGGVSGGANTIQRQIQEMREEAMRQADRDFTREQNQAGMEHESDLTDRRLQHDSEQTTRQIESNESQLDTRLDFQGGQNFLDRLHRQALQSADNEAASERLDNSQEHDVTLLGERFTNELEMTELEAEENSWMTFTNEDGNLIQYNLKTGEERAIPEGYSQLDSGRNEAFSNSRQGFIVKSLNKDMANLQEQINSGILTPEESARKKLELDQVKQTRNAILFGMLDGEQQGGGDGGSIGSDLADQMGLGGAGSPEPAPQGGAGAATPPPGGPGGGDTGGPSTEPPVTSGVPTTFEGAAAQQEEANQQRMANEAEENRASQNQKARRQAISSVGDMIASATDNPDPDAIAQNLSEARQRLEEVWQSRDDWSDEELRQLNANLKRLNDLANTFGRN